jgi:hypothetical protein
VFNIEEKTQYALLKPPSTEQIKLYDETKRKEDGPNVKNFRIDMRGKISSSWNERVIKIMTTGIVHNLKNGNEEWEIYKDLPPRSNDYIDDLVKRQLEGARNIWKNAQPKLKKDGKVETAKEVENRLIEQEEAAGHVARAGTRRHSVSWCIVPKADSHLARRDTLVD